jgi:hypothetical protein
MNAHSMFKAMPADQARTILQYFQDKDRAVYRTALETMCQIRKLRPIFIQKKPKAEQLEWIRQSLSSSALEDVALQLLQIWLLKDRQPMLVSFLDELGVSHDGKGAVDNIPEELDTAKIGSGVEKLLAAFPAAEVAVYLHMFQQQREGGWAEVARLLETDARLALKV